MSKNRVTSGVSARFGFLPRGSQQLVILFGLITLLGAVGTMAFAYVGKPIMVPALVASAAAVVAIGGWLLSSEGADWERSPPVTLVDSSTGRTITVPPRLLSNEKKLRLFIDGANALLDRHPLPKPNGMVRADGTPDVTRAAEAEAIVSGINQQLQHATNAAIDSIAAAVSGPAVAQPPRASAPANVAPGANVVSSGH